jgi:hypothetical protein
MTEMGVGYITKAMQLYFKASKQYSKTKFSNKLE